MTDLGQLISMQFHGEFEGDFAITHLQPLWNIGLNCVLHFLLHRLRSNSGALLALLPSSHWLNNCDEFALE